LFVGMGYMVGDYVDRGGQLGLPYLQYIGAGLIAYTAVQVGMIESTYPVLSGFKWHKTYYGIAAAPPRPADLVAGQLGYIGLRVLVAAVAFLIVMALFGAVEPVAALLTPLIALLVGW